MTEERECRLMRCNSISEFLTMFFGLGKKEKQSVFSDRMIIKKGTEFFRVRRVEGFNNLNIFDEREWGPVPVKYAKQGRFNADGQSVLYLASSPEYLGREVWLKEGEEYYLAHYICVKSFCVGTFFSIDNCVNTLMHKIAMSVATDEDLTLHEKMLVDDYYNKGHFGTLYDIAINPLSSFFLHRMIDNFYDVTNRLGQIVMGKEECGIRYSSVYVPIELSGGNQIITLDGVEYGNYVLTEKGYENIKLHSVEKKKYKTSEDLSTLIEVFIEEELKESDSKKNGFGSRQHLEV